MKFIVIKQSLAIAVIVLEEEILILALENTESEVNHEVTAAETMSRRHCDTAGEAPVVAYYLRAELPKAYILDKVAVVLAVDNRHPSLGMYHKIFGYEDVGRQSHTVP